MFTFLPNPSGTNGSIDNIEWKIVEPDKIGRFQCQDCSKTFSCIDSVQRHHSKVHIKGDSGS